MSISLTPRRALAACAVVALALPLLAGCSSGTSQAPGGGSSPPSASAAAALPAATATKLQHALDAWVTGLGYAGATAAVVTPEGTWSGASGVDGTKKPLQATTALPIASATKTFVAAEVMKLAGEGKVDLDKPLTDYLTIPWETHGATVRQALAMQTGFPEGGDITSLVALPTRDTGREWTAAQVVAAVDPNGARVGTLGGPTTGDIGGWYNNINYVLLGMVIEKVTGGTWAAAVGNDLLAPAGLTRVWVQPAQTPVAPVGVVTSTEAGVVDPASAVVPSRAAASFTGASGGMAADAPDLARWALLLYTGKVIDAGLVAQMTTPSVPDGYGLGTMVADWGGLPVYGHMGDMQVATSLMLAWPKVGTALAILVPQGTLTATPDTPDLATTLFGIVA